MELLDQMQQERGETQAKQTADVLPLLAGASVLYSWYQFYVRNDQARGIFVGLWPPTILAFASYFKQVDLSDRFDRM